MSAEDQEKIRSHLMNVENYGEKCVDHLKMVFFNHQCKGRLVSKFHSVSLRRRDEVDLTDFQIIEACSGKFEVEFIVTF
jgi:hypothetical protein